jgi:release factor glutamine methyltransferase
LLISEALRGAEAQLLAAGVPSPNSDSETMLALILSLSRGELNAAKFRGEELEQGAFSRFAGMVEQRVQRIPLQHLIGTAPFYGFDLEVGPGVFVPRPETEYLIELVEQDRRLRTVEPELRRQDIRVLDIGTGSGAIACALAKILPAAEVHAIEMDPPAAEYAGRNFANFAPGVTLHIGDFSRVLSALKLSFDLIVSNPPYIPSGAVPIDPEVSLYDPELALYSGDDGLDAIRAIATQLPDFAQRPTKLWLEHSDNQSSSIIQLLLGAGWTQVLAHSDLTGRLRYVSAVLD